MHMCSEACLVFLFSDHFAGHRHIFFNIFIQACAIFILKKMDLHFNILLKVSKVSTPKMPNIAAFQNVCFQ